jgi:hypothetical protein
MEKEEAAVLSLVDRVRKCRVDAELYVSKKKLLQNEVNDLYKELGMLAIQDEPDDAALAEMQELRKDIKRKEEEVEGIDDDRHDTIFLRETAQELAQYLMDHMKAGTEGENSPIVRQILPLMSNIAGEALTTMMGPQLSAYLLVSDFLRTAMIFCMTLGFLTYRLMNKHDMKIATTETPMTDQEIEALVEAAKRNEELALRVIKEGFGLDFPGSSGSGDEEPEPEPE